MKRTFIATMLLTVFCLLTIGLNAQNYHKETYQNDPMNVIHYTLDNGLQVFMSVNKDVPRIQTYIAVRVGSKNDPSESTGLSHYLEHLMFKGTTHFGTLDWAKEQVQLKEIERLYEVYNHTTDPAQRKAIYHLIDSVSYEASKYAIPNEYDKMMSMIGAQNTNAFTSTDMTVYQEDIPSNELERWLMIESDRFANPVFRLFHTELEAVYEEKNMNMAKDSRTAYEKMNEALFPHHPYGTQTTIGTIEHLKNPSLTNINKHFNTYYVPNNYCIAMSGDFDPDQAIKLIDKYFGKIQPKYIPDFTYVKEQPIRTVKVEEVYGLEPANVQIGFRIDAGTGSQDVLLAEMVDAVLMNGSCGIIDENINQKQLAQYAASGVSDMNDYAYFRLIGMPKQGQTLEQLKDLLLKQIEILKSGNWDADLLTAAINNRKLSNMKSLESNSNRAMAMAMAYLAHQNWQDVINETENMSLVTKEDVIDFAKRVFKNNNYVVVYKRQGEQRNVQKVDKPEITPVVMNRDVESGFLKNIKNIKVNPIEPVFVDFNRDMKKGKANGNEILYVQNTDNGRFQLIYRYNYGRLYDKKAGITNEFLDQLESENRTLSQINRAMYDLACDYSISFGDKYARVSISGLSENMEKAIAIVEDILNNPKISDESVQNSIQDVLKSRNDAKSRQQTIFSKMQSYVSYGKDNIRKYFVSNDEVKKITAQDVVNQIRTMTSQPQRILYYGDLSLNDLQNVITNKHSVHPAKKPVKMGTDFDRLATKDNKVYFAHYDAKQSLCRQLTTSIPVNRALDPQIELYNEYFGGSMNSIVFQEIREKRSLAYSAAAYYVEPGEKGKCNYNLTHIGTQNDKLIDALEAFTDLMDNMPVSELNFDLAKTALTSQYRTNRTRKMSIINYYLSCEEMGLKAPMDKTNYNAIQKMTMADVVNFNKTYIKGQKRVVVVLGNKNEVDLKGLEKYGKVTTLSLEDIFGY
ncbi:MAG: insulinase family protein [Bacteroidales bacterium]|nr:insulinase family protein [Bacteroidales bacterium]